MGFSPILRVQPVAAAAEFFFYHCQRASAHPIPDAHNPNPNTNKILSYHSAVLSLSFSNFLRRAKKKKKARKKTKKKMKKTKTRMEAYNGAHLRHSRRRTAAKQRRQRRESIGQIWSLTTRSKEEDDDDEAAARSGHSAAGSDSGLPDLVGDELRRGSAAEHGSSVVKNEKKTKKRHRKLTVDEALNATATRTVGGGLEATTQNSKRRRGAWSGCTRLEASATVLVSRGGRNETGGGCSDERR